MNTALNSFRTQAVPAITNEPFVDDDTEKPPNLIDEFNFKNLVRTINYYGSRLIKQIGELYIIVSEITWRVLEIHIMKIVLFSALALTVFDVSYDLYNVNAYYRKLDEDKLLNSRYRSRNARYTFSCFLGWSVE